MESNAISLWQEDYPSSLHPDEFTNPLGIIKQFFDQYTLREVQIALWSWLPFQVTDEIKLTADQRYYLFRLGNQLDRFVDAAWILVNQHPEITYEVDPKLRECIESDRLSFLSFGEAKAPVKVIRKLFRNYELHRWKRCTIYDRQQALLDPLFWMSCNSHFLREFAEYVDLNILVESAYLYIGGIGDLNHKMADDYHWSLQTTEKSDPLQWGIDYFKTNDAKDVLNSLAFLYHFKRCRQEWHPSAAYRLFQHYGDLYKLVHLAHYLTIHIDVHTLDKGSVRIIEALKIKFRKISIGRTSRFITDWIMLSPMFRNLSKRMKSDERRLKHVEDILHLTLNYFAYNTKS